MWQEIDNKTADDFNLKNGHCELLESSAWAELQRKFNNVNLLGYFIDNKLTATAIFIKKSLPLGLSYYYSPRGPIIATENNTASIWLEMTTAIKPWLKKQRALFWRIEPLQPVSDISFNQLGLIQGPDIQPSQTRMLDLGLNEEKLLQQMHSKTRYNIRLASKRGVVVEIAKPNNLADFWQLMQTTGQRDGFHLHQKEYYQAIIDAPFSRLLIAEHEGKILAAGIFAYWQDTAIYLHGASSNDQRDLMAPYLIQWEAIKLAQKSNCQRYDFFGINPERWPGVTRFKQGFGGYIVNYPGAFDLPTSYFIYKLYSLFRRLRRSVH